MRNWGAVGCCDVCLELRMWIVGEQWMNLEKLSPKRGARREGFLFFIIFCSRGVEHKSKTTK
jgi:hypothetical protein